ncbi:MAG: hypothetical protein UV57_C0005G0023 [Parcubacteria group bacterium GW2011_GWD2_43_10]|nr:MAG: hypothetical protein UV57_C0005G0023 [Parcubacteria group bacterium GW2011_GWD2_43_10]HBT92550.1 hypothetical protein [Candidatus Veblenbacteria bacterium]HCX38934.1 hypothetical protein [Candidatus Veblenbacteria bacterium]
MALVMALFINFPFVALAQTSATTGLVLEATVATEYQTAYVGEAFILDGSKSVDDGVIKTYAWRQVSGPVRFSLASGAKISIVPGTAGTYVFELQATDSAGSSSTVKKVQLVVSASAYVTQPNESDLDFIAQPTTTTKESGEKGGTEDINIGVGESSAGPALLEIDTIRGESPDDEKKGNVEINWKVEEGQKLVPVFLEIGGIDGEATETSANDRLQTAGPVTGWPAGGVFVASGDVNGLTTEQKQAFLATVKTWAEVQSEQDLQNFAVGVMMQEAQPAESLSLNYEKIKFTYNMPAKWLGIIPASYKAEVSIDKGDNENWDFGRVKVKFPWYSFLMRKGTSMKELTQVLQQEAEAKKKGNVEFEWKVEEGQKGAEAEAEITADTSASEAGKDHKDEIEILSWSFGARAMQTISNVLKTKHDTVKNSIGNIR